MKKRTGKFELLAEMNYRWPKKGDRLLRRADDWSGGVDFANRPITRHGHQWDGFLSAADGLIQLCLEKGYEHERQDVIYPILFCYRHGLELALKWMILHYGGNSVGNLDRTHDLWQLWMHCRRIIAEYRADEDKDEADQGVEQVVKDFHDLDNAGITFRYGWAKGGKEIKLPEHPVNLQNIRDVMDGVKNYFNGLDGYLSDLQSAAS